MEIFLPDNIIYWFMIFIAYWYLENDLGEVKLGRSGDLSGHDSGWVELAEVGLH